MAAPVHTPRYVVPATAASTAIASTALLKTVAATTTNAPTRTPAPKTFARTISACTQINARMAAWTDKTVPTDRTGATVGRLTLDRRIRTSPGMIKRLKPTNRSPAPQVAVAVPPTGATARSADCFWAWRCVSFAVVALLGHEQGAHASRFQRSDFSWRGGKPLMLGRQKEKSISLLQFGHW